ncbi:flagellar biosynthesis protein FlgL [Sulfurimonas aquatica]|uniref:Flagellar biosynthesis protein FlgL n=1 Tax=Sulfurimonas aquatica TaxID=2672570 RepID=A0A975B084_9BACT|nr:flagellar biosynthesis protein FlgL [Sulfurimonas aquatica]QSZ41817.1 flagellar biosynthesis protein FlgL [Sulfurimonas aquatica]
MRVTSSMYANNLYGNNNLKLNKELFDVNKQIASGLKIQYASDDIGVFTETMRLDNELTTIAQVKKSTESGYKFSNQTDVVLNEFTDDMNRMRTLLLQASNGVNDENSMDAISSELRGIEQNLRSLANTSINGKYLFSGSAVDTKPISDDGLYNGNDSELQAFLGSKNQQTYNISGADLFLGEEINVKREITTNVIPSNIIRDNPSLQQAGYTPSSGPINVNNTIRELMGDVNNVPDSSQKHFFYVSGTQHDGTTFNEQIKMKDDEKIDDLLTHIGNAYGNTASKKVVNVSMNQSGQIVIEDKIKGSSKLDFHMVGAVDYAGGGIGGPADVSNLDSLDTGSSDYLTAAGGPGLYIKEFIKSDYADASATPLSNDGLLYDRTQFSVSGNSAFSNISQIKNSDNSFATPSTKLVDVASGDTLDGKQFNIAGKNVAGIAFNAQIDFANSGTTFTIGGSTYDIFNADEPRVAVDADEMTYQQLMDVINMVVTDNLPSTTNIDTDYDEAVESSKFEGYTSLTHDGKIVFGDLNFITTKVELSLYDSNSGDFTTPASVMSFNANNAITVRDPKTDFFKTMDDIIKSVENYKLNPDSSTGEKRSVGMQEAISMMDDLQDHMFRTQSIAGAQSNRLTNSLERSELLEVSTITLRSEVLDTDLAEAALTLQQLTLNYQAMLSTVGKVSQISLINYI